MSIISQGQKEKLGQDFKHWGINAGAAYTGTQCTGQSHQDTHVIPMAGATPSSRHGAGL